MHVSAMWVLTATIPYSTFKSGTQEHLYQPYVQEKSPNVHTLYSALTSCLAAQAAPGTNTGNCPHAASQPGRAGYHPHFTDEKTGSATLSTFSQNH